MSRYMPVYQYPDSMPVDISFVFEDEKPSGKHGFCKAVGEDFRFEDGTLARFWGVIFNGASAAWTAPVLRLPSVSSVSAKPTARLPLP